MKFQTELHIPFIHLDCEVLFLWALEEIFLNTQDFLYSVT